MRAKLPTAKLADAQLTLAREYGFASWAALQAEVASRIQSPNGQWRKVRQAHVAALYPERFRQDALLEDEADIQTNLRFFTAGAVAQIGFLAAAMVGVALVFVGTGQMHLGQALFGLLDGLR
jgi:hypothetical protein